VKIELAKHKDGYAAKVAGRKHLTAFGFTKVEALEELAGVVEFELASQSEIRQIGKKIEEQIHHLKNQD
jgi:hypothetical protein